ncbi:MAG: hypothetical protein KAT62_04555 [Desulfuromonadales bacterium]|nr:hypothetical protein [Desulfuromonadales bacterium]
MKYGVLIIGLLLGVSGCASLEEAYIYDREFGQATQAALASQIVYPDRQTSKTPEGVEGITAEEIMDVYNETFAEKPQQINILTLGSASGN